jgi:hypothetical protein
MNLKGIFTLLLPLIKSNPSCPKTGKTETISKKSNIPFFIKNYFNKITQNMNNMYGFYNKNV